MARVEHDNRETFKAGASIFRSPDMPNFIDYGDSTTAATAAGIFGGCGSSADPVEYAQAGDKTFMYFNTKNTAASVTSRGLYWKHYISGAGASGEALRPYTIVEGVAVQGSHAIHAALGFGTAATCAEDHFAPLRGTLMVPNNATGMAGGGHSAVDAELYAEGALSSGHAGWTTLYRALLSGNATGMAILEDQIGLFMLEGFTIDTGNMISAVSSTTNTHNLRIFIGATSYYIMLKNAV